MPAKQQVDSTRRLIYILILGVVCAGAGARIGFSLWQAAHAEAEAKGPTQSVSPHRFDWMKEYLEVAAPPARMSDRHPCVFESMNQAGAGPHIGECETSPSLFSDPTDQFELDLRYGGFVVRQTDLSLTDGFAIPFTRSYASLDWFVPNHVHAFGKNSNQTYDIAPLGTRNPYTWMAIALEDGDFLAFERISRGTSYTNGLYRHSETNGRFYEAIIYWNGNGWTARLADGTLIVFPDSYFSKKVADGAPVEIEDASRNKLKLVRDTDHKLQEVQTPHGHWIKLTYNDQGWITRAEDDLGQWVTYLYSADGMLTNAISSSGKKRHYEYDGTNLTAVRDEEEKILLANSYSQNRVMVQQFADGQVYRYDYHWSGNYQYADSVTIQYPNGTEQTIDTGSSVPDYVRSIGSR